MALFVAGFLLSLSLCLDLGTVNIAMVRTGIQHGAQPAFMLGLGSSVGDLLYAFVSLVAISFIIQNAVVRWVLWIAGTLALLYLAYRMLKESLRTATASDTPDDAPHRLAAGTRHFGYGLGLALSSPSAILWFATVGGSVIASSASGRAALLPFFVGFFSCGVVWSVVVALISGQGRRVMGPQLMRLCSLGSACLFLYFAIKLFLDGYHTLLQM